jgi:hypothetical protein
MQRCSSMGSLAAAWQLQQLLLADTNNTAASSSGNSGSTDSSNCASILFSGESSSSNANEQSQERQQQQHLLAQLYTVTAELIDLHAVAQKTKSSQQHQQLISADTGTDNPAAPAAPAAAPAADVVESQQIEASITAAAAAAAQAAAARDLVPHHHSSTSMTPAATAVAASDSDLQQQQQQLVPVLPLPYGHYSLVHADGRPLQRPDKHPFALSRVFYDARWAAGQLVLNSRVSGKDVRLWFQNSMCLLLMHKTTVSLLSFYTQLPCA